MEIKHNLNLEIRVNNELEGFGAYLSPVENGYSDPATIIMNMNACFVSGIENDDSPKDIIIETLMHEFGHALEQYFGLPHNEELIERITCDYRAAIAEYNKTQG